MLEDRRCKVAVAADGRSAVSQASARRFDVILMDCQMPVMDGYAAATAIRREESSRGTRADTDCCTDCECDGEGSRALHGRRHGPLPGEAVHGRPARERAAADCRGTRHVADADGRRAGVEPATPLSRLRYLRSTCRNRRSRSPPFSTCSRPLCLHRRRRRRGTDDALRRARSGADRGNPRPRQARRTGEALRAAVCSRPRRRCRRSSRRWPQAISPPSPMRPTRSSPRAPISAVDNSLHNWIAARWPLARLGTSNRCAAAAIGLKQSYAAFAAALVQETQRETGTG